MYVYSDIILMNFKHGMKINDLFEDLRDGKRLIKLVEALTNKELPKPNDVRFRIQRIFNVQYALKCLLSQGVNIFIKFFIN